MTIEVCDELEDDGEAACDDNDDDDRMRYDSKIL